MCKIYVSMHWKFFWIQVIGALGSAFYPCFDLANAEAVTLSGQSVTREMVRYTNEILNKLVGTVDNEYVVAGDTDSCSKDSIIRINDFELTIEEFYNLLINEGNLVDKLRNGTEVVLADKQQYMMKSINGLTGIKNVSRHKITKDKWKVSIPNHTPLYITSDHSIIVYRNNKLIECKPEHILPTDKLVILADPNKKRSI